MSNEQVLTATNPNDFYDYMRKLKDKKTGLPELTYSMEDYTAIISIGIIKRVAEIVMILLGLKKTKFVQLIGTSLRTYDRMDENSHLKPSESEHVFQLGILLKEGTEVFGTTEQFKAWLLQENDYLDNKRPIDLLTTVKGIDYIRQIVGRIAWGDF